MGSKNAQVCVIPSGEQQTVRHELSSVLHAADTDDV